MDFLDEEVAAQLREQNWRMARFRVGMRVASNIDDGKTKGVVAKLDDIGWTMFVLIDGDTEPTSWWRGYWEEVK